MFGSDRAASRADSDILSHLSCPDPAFSAARLPGGSMGVRPASQIATRCAISDS
ncbi:MAG: hypothetical protein RL322_1685 [Pseudomonadota bacterium]|jgi:hypothetical protein